MNLSRAKFDELTHDLVEKTAEPVQNALRDAGLTAADLGQVLLVGGSTRIPAVQDKVKQLTGKEPSKSLNPDECVALGASIQGGKGAGDAGAGEILLLDVTPVSYTHLRRKSIRSSYYRTCICQRGTASGNQRCRQDRRLRSKMYHHLSRKP